MARTKFKFECFKKGHVPMAGIPEEHMILAGYLHVGRICANCKVAYFEQLSDAPVEVSQIVTAQGKDIIV